MPTYQNANLILNITYTSIQPAAGAIYTDTAGTAFTIITAGWQKYYAVGTNAPVVGTLTKSSGTGDSSVTLKSYTNNGPAIVGLTRIEPGDIVKTNEWLLNLPSGVTKSSNLPIADPTIYSVKLTSTTTVSIPTTCIDNSTGATIPLVGNYRIAVYADTGEVDVQLNDSSAVTCLIPEGLSKEWQCLSRTIDNLIVTVASTGVAYVTIEKM